MRQNRYSLKDLGTFLRDLAIHDRLPDPDESRPLLEECARIIESKPMNMGHFDAIDGALMSATDALTVGAQTREWDSLQAAMGEAWADIRRARGYARSLKRRVPDGDGFEGDETE